ncbi:MAG: phosphopentomutase [Clostridia bacterium]|nr:phosphopentomutase [Clostridia bacterium]
MNKRVFLIVLDSCGAGQMPDCAMFGDADCNTIKRISTSEKFSCENLRKMGIGNIDGLDFLGTVENPTARVARLAERSMGKDTTIGHWEIAGIVSENPLPTYPNGFPQELLDQFTMRTGKRFICNMPYSGTDVIRDYGKLHMQTGDLIVYTSADSVFQIAAHEDVVPVEQLYEYCRIAREILCGEHSVGRVIARPFTGEYPFKRTANRHDFSLEPYGKTVLDAIIEQGQTVYAIGKIFDIFAGRGVSYKVFTHSNTEGMDLTLDALDHDFEGLCFVNLVDFDMLYGHRQDIDGYANAFAEFDRWLPSFIEGMSDEDILIITADHGCDPGDLHTDHTREYVPCIIYGKNVKPANLGTRTTFSDIAATVADYLGIDYSCPGISMLGEE